MKPIYIYIIIGNVIALVVQFLINALFLKKFRILSRIALSFLSSFLIYDLMYLVLDYFFFEIGLADFLYYFVVPSYAIYFLISFRSFGQGDIGASKTINTQKRNTNFAAGQGHLELKTKQDAIKINNPFTHFLTLAGTRAGKTKSIGLNLLAYYLLNDFSGFIYDAKTFDYTRHAIYFKFLNRLKIPIFHIGFNDHNKTYRTNIVKPSVVKSYNFLAEIIRDIAIGLMEKDAKRDEWFASGLGVVQGVAVKMFFDYPHMCTLSHIALFVSKSDKKRLITFLESRSESQIYADEFLKTKNSLKTQESILSSAAQILKPIAANKDVLYVLSGDDFNFDLMEPGKRKIIAVSNDRRNASVLNGLIGSMVHVLSKNIEFGNTQKTFFFMDEGTTFKIPNFSEMLSVLGEYLVSFAFLTQSKSKIEEVYDRKVSNSLIANFNNKFLGRTNLPSDAREYSDIFGSQEISKVTKSKGSSSNERQSTHNKGESISSVDKNIFKSQDFMSLKQGEFICNFLDANYVSGKFNFQQAEIDTELLDNVILEVNANSDDVAQENFNKLLQDIDLL